MKNVIKKTIRKLGFHIYKIEDTNGDDIYQELYPKTSITNRAFYNIGAGAFSHPFWTNVDYKSNWYNDYLETNENFINYDLLSMESLPIKDETAEIIYTSHTLEHIHNQAAELVFREVNRALKIGGYFRIVVPNIDLIYRAYRENDKNFFYWRNWYVRPKEYQKVFLNQPMDQVSVGQLFVQILASTASMLHSDGISEPLSDDDIDRIFREMKYEQALDYITGLCPIEKQKKYPGNHINWWNKDKMYKMLQNAGFNTIRLSAYGQSHCPVLRDTSIFDNTHPKMSLYMEAQKS